MPWSCGKTCILESLWGVEFRHCDDVILNVFTRTRHLEYWISHFCVLCCSTQGTVSEISFNLLWSLPWIVSRVLRPLHQSFRDEGNTSFLKTIMICCSCCQFRYQNDGRLASVWDNAGVDKLLLATYFCKAHELYRMIFIFVNGWKDQKSNV